MKSVLCVEDQKVNILLKNYLHALIRWKSLRKILEVGLELNEYLQTVNETILRILDQAFILLQVRKNIRKPTQYPIVIDSHRVTAVRIHVA